MIRILIVLLFAIPLISQASEVGERVNRLINESRISRSEIGILISKDANKNFSVIYSLNDQNQFIPASLTKIVTAAAGLDHFSLNKTFKTQLLSSGRIIHNTLNSDLILKGGGDPGFVSENLWVLVNELHRKDIQQVDGNIVVDSRIFDDVWIDPGRDPENTDRAYAAPLSGMNFNWNSVTVHVIPNERAGREPKIYLDPVSDYFHVENLATTGRGQDKNIQVRRIKNSAGRDVIRVTGNIGQRASTYKTYRSVSNPNLWSGYQLKSFLKQRGIEVLGDVVVGPTPRNSNLLAQTESSQIFNSIKDLMKFSNNLIAEGITKQLAATSENGEASMGDGISKIRTFLDKLSIDRQSYSISNPAGLSRNNKFTPDALHQVLLNMKGRFDIFPELLAAFPIAGVDGTLAGRLTRSPAKGFIRGKTGTLQGVTGLAGYGQTENGEPFNFVFVFNGANETTERARQLFDRIGEAIYLSDAL